MTCKELLDYLMSSSLIIIIGFSACLGMETTLVRKRFCTPKTVVHVHVADVPCYFLMWYACRYVFSNEKKTPIIKSCAIKLQCTDIAASPTSGTQTLTVIGCCTFDICEFGSNGYWTTLYHWTFCSCASVVQLCSIITFGTAPVKHNRLSWTASQVPR